MSQEDATGPGAVPPRRFELPPLEQPALRQQIQEQLALEQQVLAAQQDAELARDMALRFEAELDEERKRLAREVGEGLAEQVVMLKTLAQTLEKRLAQQEPSLAELAAMMCANADGLLAHIRHIVRRVRPEPLVGGGLVPAVRALADDWRLRRPDQRFEVLVEPAGESAFGLGEPDVEALALRVIELALEDAAQNELWYGAPTLLVISMRRGEGLLTLQVAHDARARRRQADLAAAPGWSDLKDRVRDLSGQLSTGTGEAGGFELIAILPWPLGL